MNKFALEKAYTSTDVKMYHNLDRMYEIQKGSYRPISIQLAPTDICNLRCSFCSVDNRKGDTLEIDDMKKALMKLRTMGAKTVENTGGGDPTMYKQINELIEAEDLMGYKIGMITNGVALKKNVTQENLDRLTWLRVSMNCLDQVPEVDIPKIKGTLGFSYVWNEKSDRKMLDKIRIYKENHGAKYVRVVPNCLTYDLIDKYKAEIAPIMEDYPDFFFQTKKYDKPDRCFMGYLKPFIAPDGYIYHCSATPLINRKFDEKFRMGHMKDIYKIWSKVKPFKTESCEKCFFKTQNDIIESLIQPCDHADFL